MKSYLYFGCSVENEFYGDKSRREANQVSIVTNQKLSYKEVVVVVLEMDGF